MTMTPSGTYQPQPLLDRYYGSMLGFVLRLCGLDVPKATYDAHRQRIHELFGEFGITDALPEDHATFVIQHAPITLSTMNNLKALSPELADFFAFGSHAVVMLAGGDPKADPGFAAAAQTFFTLIDRYRLDREAIQRVLEPGWDGGLVDEAFWTEFVGCFYQLADIAMYAVPPQPDVAFVIMPFSPPFRDYYLPFYRAILAGAGYASIRAWTGVTNEKYLPLLGTIISRCGAALADVSAEAGTNLPNLNVIHEIGLAMAFGIAIQLIRDGRPVQLPSNFTGLRIWQYDSAPPEFPHAMAAAIVERMQQA